MFPCVFNAYNTRFFSKTQKKRKNPADKPSENPIITQEYCRNITGFTKISPLLTRLLLPENVGLTWFMTSGVCSKKHKYLKKMIKYFSSF